MLRSIHVKNLALIDGEEILLEDGLNILTGETGAGKSIIIGSVSAALGTGSLKDLVREGAGDAMVELIFETESEQVQNLLEQMELPVMDGCVIITRSWRNGRSISRINGETVTVAKVREAAASLIDIHGQHEHQSLLYPKYHLELVDSFADRELEKRKESCRANYQEWKEAGRKLEEALTDEKDRARQIDFLSFEIREIDEVEVRGGLTPEDFRIGSAAGISGIGFSGYPFPETAEKCVQFLKDSLCFSQIQTGKGRSVHGVFQGVPIGIDDVPAPDPAVRFPVQILQEGVIPAAGRLCFLGGDHVVRVGTDH